MVASSTPSSLAGDMEDVPSVKQRPAIKSLIAARERDLPDESCSVDPCPTPFAHAVFPPSYEEDGPTSRELLLDDRVERLLRENLELLKERSAMRSIHLQRIERSNELLAQAREGHQLAAAYVGACQAMVSTATTREELDGVMKAVDATYNALKDWAAKPL